MDGPVSTGIMMLTALLLDRLLGEPRRLHPLVGFGRLADRLESRCNPMAGAGARLAGILAVIGLIAPLAGLALYLHTLPAAGPVLDILLLYLSLGLRSLMEHGSRVADAVIKGDMPQARRYVGWIVSRETHTMNRRQVIGGATESILENGCDAVFGALFWFLLLGGPGALAYRLVNTLDAMWGYKTPRLHRFGWCAARLDDLMNLVPAFLTALTYALCGHLPSAMRAWHAAPAYKSPNAGRVMAAGAGAIQVRLGGPAIYHGKREERPVFGWGPFIHDLASLQRAMDLVQHGALFWLTATLLVEGGPFA